MSDQKRKDEEAYRKQENDPDHSRDQPSEGQYGGLRSLGPGGGAPLEEALDTDDIEPDADEIDRK